MGLFIQNNKLATRRQRLEIRSCRGGGGLVCGVGSPASREGSRIKEQTRGEPSLPEQFPLAFALGLAKSIRKGCPSASLQSHQRRILIQVILGQFQRQRKSGLQAIRGRFATSRPNG